jgi:hypothetical protein
MLAASIILITASPAFAQFQKPEDAIKYRQSALLKMQPSLQRYPPCHGKPLALVPKVVRLNPEFGLRLLNLKQDQRKCRPRLPNSIKQRSQVILTTSKRHLALQDKPAKPATMTLERNNTKGIEQH